MERIKEILDGLDVKYETNDNSALVEFWTDTANQDIPVEFDYDGTPEDFVKEFARYAENYDVDSEVEIFIPMRGQRGTPSSIRTLLDDCQEAKDTLMEIAGKLEEVVA